MSPNCLAETESALAEADRLWRAEMNRYYGPDGVLHYGFEPRASGPAGTRLRQTYDARRTAITAWRHARRTKK